MKTPRFLLFFLPLVFWGCHTPPATMRNGVPLQAVVVNFSEPEKFTDAREFHGDSYSQVYLDDLADYLKKAAAGRLAAGEKLVVTFTDIDLAGDFDPSRPLGQGGEVRLVRASDIPKLTFTYRVETASGNVVREEQRALSDLNFQNRIATPLGRQSDPLRYEKQMIDDWLRADFPEGRG